MKFGINTLDDFNLEGKTVLCRVDINQPVDKETAELKDITRILRSLETIEELSGKGAKTVLLAHQGSDVEYQNYYTLRPHAAALELLLDRKVKFIEDVCGPAALEAIKGLNESDILLLENVRFMAEEMTFFETRLNLTPLEQTRTQVVKKLAPLGDLYVCDAFAAAHRAQPTLVAMEELLPSCMGRLFEKEYSILSKILADPPKPSIFVLGGAKVQDAFLMMEKVLNDNVADQVLTGGLVSTVMLLASGVELGAVSTAFLVEKNLQGCIELSRKMLDKYGDRIMLPTDQAYVSSGRRITVSTDDLPVEHLLVDIGEETAEIYVEEILKAQSVFLNGPMGVYENELSERGTKSVWRALARTGGMTVLGGGDSAAAANKYDLQDEISHICTGGGAMVRFLSGEELPVVTALKRSAVKFNGNSSTGAK